MHPDALMLIALIGAHYFFDFAGQGDFMAKAKNESAPIPGVPWDVVMMAHCGIHGAAVALITGIWWLGALEYVAHLWTDRAKCRGKIDFYQDQGIHIVCKALWFACAVWLA
jgi:hypothetical protein